MIKHDYKPQNNKRFFKQSFFDHLPVWATHPYMILSVAALTMILTYMLSKNNESLPQDNNDMQIGLADTAGSKEIESTVLNSDSPEYESGEITIQASSNSTDSLSAPSEKEAHYGEPIDIPLQLETITSLDNRLKPLENNNKWLRELRRYMMKE